MAKPNAPPTRENLQSLSSAFEGAMGSALRVAKLVRQGNVDGAYEELAAARDKVEQLADEVTQLGGTFGKFDLRSLAQTLDWVDGLVAEAAARAAASLSTAPAAASGGSAAAPPAATSGTTDGTTAASATDPQSPTSALPPGGGGGSAVPAQTDANQTPAATADLQPSGSEGSGGGGGMTLLLGGNQPPVAVNDSRTIVEDTVTTINVLENDSDPDGHHIFVTAAGGAANGKVTFTASTVTYKPNLNYYGSDSLTYTITDGHFDDQGQLGTDTATVNITVTPVDDVPTANTDYAMTSQSSPVTINVAGNDFDPEGSISVVYVQPWTQMRARIINNYDGTVTYDPRQENMGGGWDPGEPGRDVFNYKIFDSIGQWSWGEVNVYVTDDVVDDCPFCVTETAVAAEGTSSLTIDVLANDMDGEGPVTLYFAGLAPFCEGTVVANPDGTVTYTPPDPDWYGPSGIGYTVRDSAGQGDWAYVAVFITPVNDPPVASPDEAEAWREQTIGILPLGNDTDIDGGDLILTNLNRPAHCDVWFDETTVHFTALETFQASSTVVLNYTVADGHGGAANSTISVLVKILDLKIFDGQGGNAVADSQEESRGAFTVANLNDTDGDDMPDYTDDVVIATPLGRNEKDLMRLEMSVQPASALTGQVSLYASGTIALWQEETKGTRIPMDGGVARFEPSTFVDGKKTIWVELTAPSAELRDNQLQMVYSGGSDLVKATGVWAALTAMEDDTKSTSELFGVGSPWVDMTDPPRELVEHVGGTGLRPINSDNGVANVAIMRYHVLPDGIQAVADVKFDIGNRVKSRWWFLDANNQVTSTHTVDFPEQIEEANDEGTGDMGTESLSPDNSGDMYFMDGPGLESHWALGNQSAIGRYTFEQFIRVGIGSRPQGNAVAGSRASETHYWHCRHSLAAVDEIWTRTTGDHMETDVNDVGEGQIDVGNSP